MEETKISLEDLLPQTLLPLCWNHIHLTKSHLEKQPPLHNIAPYINLPKALSHLTLGLSFFTHLRVFNKLKNTLPDNEILNSFGYKQLQYIQELLPQISLLPKDFYNWAEEKGLNPKDLRGLIHDYTPHSPKAPLFSHINHIKASKNTGLLILEYSLDLLASEKINLDYILSFKSPDVLLKSLKKKRFQNTYDQDKKTRQALSQSQASLNKNIKVSMKRVGDENQIKLELTGSSPTQLKSLVHKLEDSLNSLQKNLDQDPL